ncbi:MAG: hypothetical protein ABIW85_10650, partial [Variovorax sp.]
MAVGEKIGLRAAGLCCAGLLAGCGARASNYTWGWYLFDPLKDKGQSNLKFLMAGLESTILISLCAIVVSVMLGSCVALAALARKPWLVRASRV